MLKNIKFVNRNNIHMRNFQLSFCETKYTCSYYYYCQILGKIQEGKRRFPQRKQIDAQTKFGMYIEFLKRIHT